jgi:N-acetylglucosamine malate deacetylase 1
MKERPRPACRRGNVNILAVGAHPDDLEQLCGGTLIKYARAGHTVTACHATLGDRGSFTHTSEEIAVLRLKEAQQAAAVMGTLHSTLHLSDGEVNAADPAQRRLVVDLIREARPDIILTHATNDYMADHVETSRLVLDASHIATLPLLRTEHPAHRAVSPVLYFDPLAGVGFDPTEYVDVSDVFEQKLEALQCHQSQLVWLKDHDGVDIVDQTRVMGAFRGYQCGVRYAEGFRSAMTWLRAAPRRLLP